MEFERDAAKDRSNQAKHSISFNEAIAIFADPDLVILDATQARDDESRSKAIGLIGGHLFVVVFTERGTARRIISARRTNRKEEQAYGPGEVKA